MGRCPKPRKFFEKNLTKNFHTGKVFGVHCAFDGCIPSCHPERRAKPVVELRRSVRSTGSTRGDEYPSEIPTLCVALRVRLHFVPLRMTRTDCSLEYCCVKFYASGKMISSPTMNIIKNAPYRRGGYYPPEYNKKDFRQSENLPKLFIFHYSIFIKQKGSSWAPTPTKFIRTNVEQLNLK